MICREAHWATCRCWRGRNCWPPPGGGPRPIANIPPHRTDPHGLLFLAGHQPQMFHPGVWYKNFALGELAGGTGRRP